MTGDSPASPPPRAPPPPPPQLPKKKHSESSSVLFGGSEILNLLCCLGIRNSESSPVFLGIRNSESTRALFGRSAILDALLCFCKGWHLLMNCRLCSLRFKKLEFLPVFSMGNLALGTRNSDNPLKERIGDCLEEFYDSLQTGRRLLWVLTPVYG